MFSLQCAFTCSNWLVAWCNLFVQFSMTLFTLKTKYKLILCWITIQLYYILDLMCYISNTALIILRSNFLWFNLVLFSADPYWELLSPPIQYASVGTDTTLSSQYASLSEGHGNNGPGLLFGLRYVSFYETTYPIIMDQPSEKFSYRFEYRFAVNSSSQGRYDFSGIKSSYA